MLRQQLMQMAQKQVQQVQAHAQGQARAQVQAWAKAHAQAQVHMADCSKTLVFIGSRSLVQLVCQFLCQEYALFYTKSVCIRKKNLQCKCVHGLLKRVLLQWSEWTRGLLNALVK